MAKSKRERIAKRKADIAAAQQRIQAEEAKISVSRKRIKAERRRISCWDKEVLKLHGELLAEQVQASNLTLEDALAALDLQGEEQT